MSKVETIRSKFKTIRDNTFLSLSNGDTTPTKKYLERMCHYWTTKGTDKLYMKTLIDTIKDFETHIPYIENKDIYHPKYNRFIEVFNVVELAKLAKFDKEFTREEHVDVIYETDSYLVVCPKTFKGSMKYGAGTRWCTAGKKYESTFKSYLKNNHLIYVINKSSNNSSNNKMALLQSKSKGIDGLVHDSPIIYKPDDSTTNIRWFTNNGWDEDELVKIFSHINLFKYKKDKFSQVKENVDSAIASISAINLIEIMNNINVLKNVDLIGGEEMKKHKNVIDDFVSKITELSKSY